MLRLHVKLKKDPMLRVVVCTGSVDDAPSLWMLDPKTSTTTSMSEAREVGQYGMQCRYTSCCAVVYAALINALECG